ncbi:MAG: hypothetical protein CGU28_12630 [Candidatus Dactylopiibacterium carminicum]|uniref:Uncharacterized protein n=1 Tax=Candidatus Dactylopiibacterium carminicum TaxID=857335 RepID=A0A272EPL7_9RHOO|nr:hypothetical protein [Candidatus Dactylopiibacterium carminicum]KAF7598326.1 hypothetical protein BGI27_13810 [Candidatus Dactylopiibacterium carminicum]PAS92057.1 MAG: hypothetical protein CGU29_13310 [Candidatus Dactylopiibacterium carminicum]PAS95483.1 MAG: hypothetical protein CGU28_12630 [Candidatus Dactylopiibacterium carminicum]PAS97378.1 MAG: hypothetical protein BSR46_13835 [Candidatus Dactylopiibacterium carminicum]
MHPEITALRRSPPERTYIVRTLCFMAIYILINAAAIVGLFDDILGQPAGWAVAVAVTAPVVGQIWATLRLMAQSDEYVRVIVAKCFVLAAGGTLALWTAWGFGETYAAATHIPGWLIYPCFWAIYALVSPFVRTSH